MTDKGKMTDLIQPPPPMCHITLGKTRPHFFIGCFTINESLCFLGMTETKAEV